MKLIKTYHADLLNGTGLREVLFLSGCTHHCPGCFNPETWDPDFEEAHEWTEEDWKELKENISKPYISGVTFSGGDPLFPSNQKGVLDLCKLIKENFPDKTIWLYTGYTYEHIQSGSDLSPFILEYVDVLCDGPFIESQKSPKKPWVGSENQRVIDVQESLKQDKVILYEK